MTTKSVFTRVASVAALTASALMGSVPAVHASINYGDFDGVSVMYLDVTENSQTDPTPLYGAPTISVDTLDFNPIGLGAFATDGGIDLTDAQLEFGIMAKEGYGLQTLMFIERGDYTLGGLGTAATYVDITTSLFLDIIEVDGVGITPIKLEQQMVFSPNASGLFELPSDGGVNVIWTGSLSVDLNAVLAANNIDFQVGVTKATVNLDNTIFAQSESGTTAFLAKKDLGVSIVSIVPEPTAAAFLLLGLGAMAWSRRKS